VTLTDRWYPLRMVPEYEALVNSTARFDVIEAGRRSGKTELVKRLAVEETWSHGHLYGQWFTKLCAPTLRQAVDIYWADIQDLTKPMWSRAPNITDKVVYLRGGGEIWICGLDKPQRIEGSPINRLGVDELADVKVGAWDRHLKPALDTEHPGMPAARAWLYGVPRPGSQFEKLANLAQDPTEPDFAYHTWTSEAVLSTDKIEAAKRTMDDRIYAQEYLAKRVSMEGMAYYQWSRSDHLRDVRYIDSLPIIIALDFNVEPGTAVIMQEQLVAGETTTCVIAEVHIPRNSSTPAVARKLVAEWGKHKGEVHLYGDPAGGARHTSQTEGSDWELVRQILRPVFGERIRWHVPRAHPYIRDRVNSVNARMRSADGVVRFAVNPKTAPNVVKDFEGVKLLAGGSGEVDKKGGEKQGLTHLSEAVGYYIHKKHPVQTKTAQLVTFRQ
jgi:hypothetical protein